MVWRCVFFRVITASATIKLEPMTLENRGFPEYVVFKESEPKMLHVAVTRQVNITIKSSSDPKKEAIKLGGTSEP